MRIKPFYFFLMAAFLILAIGFFSVMQWGAAQDQQPGDILDYRHLKDNALKSKVGAPFYGQESFDSLRYFPFNPEEVFITDFFPLPPGQNLDLMPDRAGYDSHRLAGYVFLSRETWTDTLFIFKALDEKSDTLFFAPFLDETNGKQTYGGGRYLDVVIKKGKPVRLDFNYAYNPYCAYNEEFICARVPNMNSISRPIAAGEMNYP